MTWRVEFEQGALKSFLQIDKPQRSRINVFLDRLLLQDSPRQQGKALTGKYSGLWRYRVGDYRLICHIEDENLLILVVDVGHRKEIYK